MCQNVTFFDVDYPDLMRKKCEVITTTPQLQDLLRPLEAPTNAPLVFLRSGHYTALGCDLADISTLDSVLASEFDISDCLTLCIAEVSVTYMNVEAADALIAWSSRSNDSMLLHIQRFICCMTDTASTLLSA